jgi:hypothetical protein
LGDAYRGVVVFVFPPKQDIAFFEGDRLDVVSMGQYTLHFSFDGECSITAEYALTYIRVGEPPVRYDIQNITSAPAVVFHRCIGQKIAVLDVEDLLLRFTVENGDVIEFESQECPYECGQITRVARSGTAPVFIVF